MANFRTSSRKLFPFCILETQKVSQCQIIVIYTVLYFKINLQAQLVVFNSSVSNSKSFFILRTKSTSQNFVLILFIFVQRGSWIL